MRIILFSDARPRLIWRLAARIEQEAPATTICGVVYARPCSSLRPNRDRLAGMARRIVDLVLRWMHACPRNPNGPSVSTDEDLMQRSRAAGWPILITSDPRSRDVYDFVRGQNPDLGVVLQTRTLPEDMLLIPRRGSIAARSSPGLPLQGGNGDVSPAGTPSGQLPEEVKIEVVHLEPETPGAVLGSITLASEPYDTSASLRLKTDLLTNDVLVQAVTALTAGPGSDDTPPGVRCPTWTQPPAPPPGRRGRDGSERPQPAPEGRSSSWKAYLYVAVLWPYWVVRNWRRRLGGRCPVIVLFHHLATDRPHHLGMSTHAFFQAVRFLQRHYRVLSLSEAVDALASGSVNVPSVVLTMDDGYGENFLTLRAVMEETGVPLTFFVNTAFIGQDAPFPHDVKRGQSEFRPLTWEQLAYLARNGAEIGSHTRSHFDCGSRDRAALEREIVGSKRDLELRLGGVVRFFAFPWGQPANMSPEAVEIASATHTHVFAACGGENLPGRQGPSGVLLRTFHCPDLWALEFTLQSVFDLALSLRLAWRRVTEGTWGRTRRSFTATSTRPGQ